MKEEIRRAAAATVLKEVRGSYPSSLYSYSTGRHTNMEGGYDYDARAHYSNSYHYGNRTHYTISVNDNTFSGFDYGDSHHFSGTVNDNSITIYDYGEGKYYRYSA